MSTDKLAETIRNPYGSSEDGYRVDPHSAAARVREAFVVIDRNDLPEAKPSSDGYGAWAGGTFFHPDQEKELRSTAHQYLAIAEHLRANPPVDAAREEKVRKVRYALTQALGPVASHAPLDRAARLLVEALEED